MSDFWASRPLVLALLAPLALDAAAPAPAAARNVVDATVVSSGGRVTKRISIDGREISISSTGSDSDSSRITIRGDIEAGPIVVRSEGSGIVRLFSDAEVGRGERVEGDVVAVFGSVRVDGEVSGSVVAVFGSVDLRSEAVVRGDAVAVGGAIREDPGARVSGDTVQAGFLPLTLGLPGLPVVLSGIVLAWLVTLFFGWAAAALFPLRLTRVAVTSSQRTAASLAIGVASGPLMLVTMLMLMVTVVGIPIAVFLPLVFVAVAYLGQIAATCVLGCKLTRRRPEDGRIMGPLLSGSLLVASVFGFGAILWETPGMVRTVALFFVMLGVLLVLGLSAIGTGAILLSRGGSRPREVGLDPPGTSPKPSHAPGAVTGT
jgi:cytoskeletal protein CcmA (bactofilin family)